MIIESRKLEQIQLRHSALKHAPAGDCVVWWYGALRRNHRNKTLPLVVVWFRKLLPDGSLGPNFRLEVGITELALLQLGTIWNNGSCQRQLQLEEREVSVNFSQGGWRYTSQARANNRPSFGHIPSDLYPLHHGGRDRSEILVFDLNCGRELLVPSLEFFSRCYGRSAEVNRVLSTYPWSEAEPRLHLVHTEPVPSGDWAVKLPADIYNDDALIVAHMKYDAYAKNVAKSIYSNLETQFNSSYGLGFPQIGPWFVGPAKLIVQGIPLDRDRFLALRIVGGSEPAGPHIWSFRENPGIAEEPASEGASQSTWTGRRGAQSSSIQPLVNITPTDPAGHDGNIVEVSNPSFRILGPRREVRTQKLRNAKTRPGPLTPDQKSEKHSPGEREGTDSSTGVASIHTETKLESRGAARDLWMALLHLHNKTSKLIEEVGWYNPQLGNINFTDREPSLVSLQPYGKEKQKVLPASKWKWVYIDPDQERARGVLIAFVKAQGKFAYLFEIERRTGQRLDKDGNTYDKEQSSCGLIVSPPANTKPSDWIPKVLEGIRREQGGMPRVMRYCPGNQVHYYRRSFSKADEIAGHSTVVVALGKVNIDLPHPKSKPRRQKDDRSA